MERRDFFKTIALSGAALPMAGAAQGEAGAAVGPPPLLANEHVTVYESPSPSDVYAYSPGIARLESGRLIVTMDRGGKGVNKLADITKSSDGKLYRGLIFTSDDRGRTWQPRGIFPMSHARPFAAGGRVYILGQSGDLGILYSEDDGNTWSETTGLTSGERWHQAPCNVDYAHGRVYLVMEKNTLPSMPGWPVSVLAPVVMAAPVDADLNHRDAWTFSNELSYVQAAKAIGGVNGLGEPFFALGLTDPDDPKDKRGNSPSGWLETHILRFPDPDHVWHDPEDRTMYLFMRAHTGTSNLACVAKAVEDAEGNITVMPATAPSGKPILYLPWPGGHLKFHVLHDPVSERYWMVSNQSTDSMTKPTVLPDDRYNLPNNERHRLVLHFSKNGVDWCFAGRVADTRKAGQPRNYPGMCIDGEDLHILARSGDARSASAHNGNLLTFHTVRGFRGLVY
jgi:hypothetical protein